MPPESFHTENILLRTPALNRDIRRRKKYMFIFIVTLVFTIVCLPTNIMVWIYFIENHNDGSNQIPNSINALTYGNESYQEPVTEDITNVHLDFNGTTEVEYKVNVINDTTK